MEIIYKVNGRTFHNKEEAEKYEKVLTEEKEKEEKLKAEKEARWKEVDDAWKRYYDLLSKYENDYKEKDYYTLPFDLRFF